MIKYLLQVTPFEFHKVIKLFTLIMMIHIDFLNIIMTYNYQYTMIGFNVLTYKIFLSNFTFYNDIYIIFSK